MLRYEDHLAHARLPRQIRLDVRHAHERGDYTAIDAIVLANPTHEFAIDSYTSELVALDTLSGTIREEEMW
jgi:hypothetical protein